MKETKNVTIISIRPTEDTVNLSYFVGKNTAEGL